MKVAKLVMSRATDEQSSPNRSTMRSADDLLVAGAAGEGPAAHRDPVAGDRHRDDHLRQVAAVVLGVPKRAGLHLVEDEAVQLVGPDAPLGAAALLPPARTGSWWGHR